MFLRHCLQALQLLGQVHFTRPQQGHFLDTLRVLLRLVERFLGDIRLVERFLGEARRVLRFGDAIIIKVYKLFIFCIISSSLNSTLDSLLRS